MTRPVPPSLDLAQTSEPRIESGESRVAGPPLSLYIHFPWCVSKCPYCDFNSFAWSQAPLFEAYIKRLLEDLDADLSTERAICPLQSIFIGGGTPSLLSGRLVAVLLDGVRARAELEPGIEITLEANPGTADAEHFAGYREAGVNRLSIGVQSLSAAHLARLGRVHDPSEARAALRMARAAGFDNLNLDMMFALPRQSLAEAGEDLDKLMELDPEHISYYQLTLEPSTGFHARPPELPDLDLAADMGAQGIERLAAAGYGRYEISAFSKPGRRCRHNLNYWTFGDYVGIGAGAHGKLTEVRGLGQDWVVRRSAKESDPRAYLGSASALRSGPDLRLSEVEILLEIALNVFRLTEGFPMSLLEERAGLDPSRMRPYLESAAADGLVSIQGDWVRPTTLGQCFLDDLVSRFMP